MVSDMLVVMMVMVMLRSYEAVLPMQSIKTYTDPKPSIAQAQAQAQSKISYPLSKSSQSYTSMYLLQGFVHPIALFVHCILQPVLSSYYNDWFRDLPFLPTMLFVRVPFALSASKDFPSSAPFPPPSIAYAGTRAHSMLRKRYQPSLSLYTPATTPLIFHTARLYVFSPLSLLAPPCPPSLPLSPLLLLLAAAAVLKSQETAV